MTDTPAPAAPPPAGPSVSVYDLDRTLTRRATWLPFLVRFAARRAPWRLLRLPEVLALMAAYGAGRLTRDRLKALMQARLMGPRTPGAVAREEAEAFADALVGRGLRPEVATRLRADVEAGRTVVVATAALALYAGPVARRLGVPHVLATASAWRDDHLLARLDGPNLRGPAKLAAVEAWLAAHPHLAVGGFRFHSDNVSDLPLLERAAEPVAVAPRGRLRRIARARGWEVLG